MRHHNKNRKFGRKRDVRRALLRSLALSLIQKEKIITTEAKARELRPFIEKLVTRGKIKSLASERLLVARLGNKEGSHKLIKNIAPRFQGRNGGYTRIIKLGERGGDASKMAVIEFI
ncbi:MAG: 50S ribosomal protein L17 [bacterium]|nr:50S ribosomal protein L17 [bacterium]